MGVGELLGFLGVDAALFEGYHEVWEGSDMFRLPPFALGAPKLSVEGPPAILSCML